MGNAVYFLDNVTLAQDMLWEELGLGKAAEVLKVDGVLVFYIVFDESDVPYQ